MRRRRAIIAVPVVALLLACCAGTGAPDTSGRMWPIVQEETLPGGVARRMWCGPLIRETTTDGVVETIVGPLARIVKDGDRTKVHVLQPFFTQATTPNSRTVHLRPLFHDKTLKHPDGRVDHDWGLIPFLFGGSETEEADYFMLFPFWGEVRGLFGKDEMRVRLFPLYADTRVGAYESTHLLWPLVSWGSGESRTDFRILPFLMIEEIAGSSEYTSLLWPILQWGVEGLNTKHPIETTLVFPFYGRRDSDMSWSRTYMYPFFAFAGAEGYTDVQAPWPLFRYTKGPDETRMRVWPIFGHHRKGADRTDFYVWPIVTHENRPLPDGHMDIFRIAPIMSRTRVFRGDGMRATDQFWPLLRNERTPDGTVRLGMPDLLPYAGWRDFRRSYAWMWTLLDHRRDAEGRHSTDLLYGLVQLRDGPDETYAGVPLLIEYASDAKTAKVHLLKGLAGYEVTPDGPAIRLLWFLRLPL
jgi:hypothetical protein